MSTRDLSATPAASYAITLSRAYLEKAREEASEAHYASAVALAKASQRAAADAQRTQVRHVAGSPSRLESQPAEGRR